jgi:hypothetical protein
VLCDVLFVAYFVGLLHVFLVFETKKRREEGGREIKMEKAGL